MFQAMNIRSLVICFPIPGCSISHKFLITAARDSFSHAESIQSCIQFIFVPYTGFPARKCVGNPTYKALDNYENAVSYLYLHRNFK